MQDQPSLPTLVLIHGLFSSPLEFALTSQILRSRGVRFDCLEIPGYTLADRRRPSSWRNWLHAARAALDARYGPEEPIVLGGLCVGGALAAALAASLAAEGRQQRVCGVIMLSPTFDYDGWSLTRWRHLRRLGYALGLARWITIREREPFGIKNPKIRKWVMREFEASDVSSIGPSRLPLWGLRESERLHAHVRPLLRALSVPLMVLHAREDEITSLSSVERWTAALGNAARLIVLEHSYHMITIDNDRQRVAHELADFVGAPKNARVPLTASRPVAPTPKLAQSVI